MHKANKIWEDSYLLGTNDYRVYGCYQLRKSPSHPNQHFIDQLLVSPISAQNCQDALPSSYVGQIFNSELFNNIEDGDIALISGRGSIRVILSRRARHNTVLVTEQCDNLCLFCSQPPKENDDRWLLAQASLALSAFDSTEVIGVSGGEPLLFGDSFIDFLTFVLENNVDAKLHILTNGRRFKDAAFTRRVAEVIAGRDVCFGIPLYSSRKAIHDKLVGKVGAFDDTLKGLLNAGNSGIPIELRIIPTQHNVDTLVESIELIGRSLSSISQVSIMNLEAEGWAKKNWESLYLDPSVYMQQLQESVNLARSYGISIALFNYPLCQIHESLHSVTIKSISDWKNYFPDSCNDCIMKPRCSGLFSSSKGKFLINIKEVCND